MMRPLCLVVFCIVFTSSSNAQRPNAKCTFEIVMHEQVLHPVDSSDFPRYAMNESLPVFEIPAKYADDTLYLRVTPDSSCHTCRSTLRGIECYFEGAGDSDTIGFTTQTIFIFPLEQVNFDDGYGESCEILFEVFLFFQNSYSIDSQNLFILRLK